MAMTTKPVEVCSLMRPTGWHVGEVEDCGFEASDPRAMDRHISAQHPEMLEDDPLDTGVLYRKTLLRHFRGEELR